MRAEKECDSFLHNGIVLDISLICSSLSIEIKCPPNYIGGGHFTWLFVKQNFL